MKPIKLHMEFIGPYKNETIDFRDLNNSLFLISGRTGSGKSMIFDAITYALFATASTESRGGESLRSQFASDDELSKVHLDFSHRGKEYRIERVLTYKKRKNKTPTTGQAAIYNEFGELLASGLKEVSVFVEDLLQMTARQFRQIALLPQGEFKKLLTANSGEKEEILKTLFGTERFNDVYKSIYKEFKTKENNLDLLSKEIETKFSVVTTEPIFEFNTSLKEFEASIEEKREDLSKKRDGLKPVVSSIEKLSEEIDLDRKHNEKVTEYKNTETSLKDLVTKQYKIKETEKTLHVVEELSKIKEIFNLEKSISKKLSESVQKEDELSKSLEYDENELKTVTYTIDNLKNKENLIESKEKKLSTLNKHSTERYNNLDSSIQHAENEIAELKSHTEKLTNDISLKTKELEETDVSYDALRVLSENRHSLQLNITELKRDIEDAEREEKKVKELELHLKEHDKLMNELIIMEKEKDSILKAFTEMSLETSDSIHHLLSHLEVGKPCPVCQTIVTEYPEHKEMMDESTKETLTDLMNRIESLKKEIDTLEIRIEAAKGNISDERKDMNSLNEALSKLNVEFKNIEEKYTYQNDNLKKKEALDREVNELKQLLTQKREALTYKDKSLSDLKNMKDEFVKETGLNDFNSLKKEIDVLSRSINNHHEMLKESETKRQDLLVKITKLNTEVSSLKENIESFEANLNEYTPKIESFLEKYDSVDRSNIEDYFKIDYNSLKNEVDTFYSNVHELEFTLNKLKETLDSFDVIDVSKKEERLVELETKKNELTQLITETEYQLNKDLALKEELVDLIKKYNDAREIVRKLSILEKIINGNSEGKRSTHPTLSRFVLIHYLELILVYANKRLTEMTNGRYELRRKDTYNASEALIIDVFDHFNNETRNIATLSGGETFQASLALSLSLSEVIQHEAGSINMDMLLIDEGFGTLDEETLNTAINTLVDIQTRGKMVGIISHVEELKTRLQNIIYVETENERSTTKIVTYLS
ncbi:AAA family ATPase [Nosocomiicoccus ampullae]|uniref:Nuclease SbcCD subunit C n=1 Tax=Nosocomiicoccus ampullae TaxID=489910 RepID=A0A9Q2D0B1_9STAP|nr:AAA family ATPase [Nosocomiicoccus ampullae]MBB5176311.1 exonuclease SbcC [Nosocomiicoccus ampullae]QYA47471.1 AAA family ATPase [Nosocomiicoccus ampullae]